MASLLPPPNRPPKPAQNSRGSWAIVSGSGLAVTLALAVVVGLQLGALPWRFRKEIWQLQGAVAGGLVGYLVGWSVARSSRRETEQSGEPRL